MNRPPNGKAAKRVPEVYTHYRPIRQDTAYSVSDIPRAQGAAVTLTSFWSPGTVRRRRWPMYNGAGTMVIWWLLILSLWQTPISQSAAPAPSPALDAIITGRVIDPAGAPVGGAVVTFQPALIPPPVPGAPRVSPPRVLTDDDGRYFFDQLAPGSYTLTTTKAGWANGSAGAKRVNGPGAIVDLAEHERKPNVDITMWKFAAISGTLVDEAGEPIVDVQVRAVYRPLVSGKRRMTFAGTARTDDRGVYRLANLVPGEYSVFVPATVMSGPVTFGAGGAPDEWLRTMTGEGTAPMSFDFNSGIAARNSKSVVTSVLGITTPPSADSSWLAIPPSFAGAPGVAGAATFTLASGQDRIGVDMQLRVTQTFPVSGVLSIPEGSPANLVLHLMSAGLEDYPLFDVATATTDASGAFTFFGVPTGEYVIRVVRAPLAAGMRYGMTTTGVMMFSSGPGGPSPALPTEPLLHATEKVSVSTAPVRNLQIALRPGPRVSGRAEFSGSAKRPEPSAWGAASFLVQHANGYQSVNPPRAQFAGDGTFATPSLLPGDYYLRPISPAGWFLKSVTWQGHNIIDAPLALAGTDVTDVIVTYTDRPGSIRGTVYGTGDAVDGAAAVLLFPVDQELWTDYGLTSPRMRAVRTKADGTFSAPSLIDGEYFMIAIPEDQAADWQDPATLAKLARTAKRVLVREGESSNENLKTERIK